MHKIRVLKFWEPKSFLLAKNKQDLTSVLKENIVPLIPQSKQTLWCRGKFYLCLPSMFTAQTSRGNMEHGQPISQLSLGLAISYLLLAVIKVCKKEV